METAQYKFVIYYFKVLFIKNNQTFLEIEMALPEKEGILVSCPFPIQENFGCTKIKQVEYLQLFTKIFFAFFWLKWGKSVKDLIYEKIIGCHWSFKKVNCK